MISPKFSSLPIFVAVVELGSFSAAAGQLNITKSAVSKRLTQLEEILGVRLFHRTTRKIHLTEAGERLYFYASQSLSYAKQGLDSVLELQGEPQGKLKIATPMSFGVRHIAPYVSEFMKQYPKLEIEVELEDQMVDLLQGGFDLAIRIGRLPMSNMIAKRLTDCQSVLCASPEYVDQFGFPEHPADLRHHNCLIYSYFRGGQAWTFHQRDKEYKVVPKGNLVMNNSEGIRRAALDGLGIAQLPTFMIGKDLTAGLLVPVMSHYHLPNHAVYAVYPDRQYLPHKVRLFIDFIQSRFGIDTPYWDQALTQIKPTASAR
ncbi:LysR family transcriptional regulator [Vibrio gazogenes]|uniref:Transcriptional regulator n=1 Tax=Vibrio gazogenes DSM 21264 = NBRC 103151 TaxID=1123492 RepID=A0A1M5C7W9_VIBGA|nr:LysR family transcriptional regulator [Vibrio gazogenes]USP16301.1 LysR family transcriptional regulator [Vibrio gazogenes]SHF50848.1 transcriptional regulator [Vibrio gazogenes DSM 21264] [Vibrio gazogenes DSM 21264 = NBRC 103151]